VIDNRSFEVLLLLSHDCWRMIKKDGFHAKMKIFNIKFKVISCMLS
jgi:hypothetical protein